MIASRMLFAILVLTFIIEMRLIPDRRPIHWMCVVRQAHTTQHRPFCVSTAVLSFFHSDHSDFGNNLSSAVQSMEFAGDRARLKLKIFCGMLCCAVPCRAYAASVRLVIGIRSSTLFICMRLFFASLWQNRKSIIISTYRRCSSFCIYLFCSALPRRRFCLSFLVCFSLLLLLLLLLSFCLCLLIVVCLTMFGWRASMRTKVI